MPACEGCYRAKVRCDQSGQKQSFDDKRMLVPCSRCRRLGLECVARTSRQGQGPKKRKLKNQAQQVPDDDGLVDDSADGTLVNHASGLGRYHYGVLYLIHSWISFAFARRSFSLLNRASRLAAKAGVSMDEIFYQARKHILDSVIYSTTAEQQQCEAGLAQPRLRWSDVPAALLSVCGAGDNDGTQQRYIWIREAQGGQSRFLVSSAFQRDIASIWLLEKTWAANEKSIIQVFTEGASDNEKFTKAISYQMARYTEPAIQPERMRVNGLRVKVKNAADNTSVTVQEMDLLYAFEIVTLEHSFYLAEFVPPPSTSQQKRQVLQEHCDVSVDVASRNYDAPKPGLLVGEEITAETKVSSSAGEDVSGSAEDLDGLSMDEDLREILALINDDD